MGWNDRQDEWFETNLPPEALVDGMRVTEIENSWLTAADPDMQRQAMKAWFLARYCDPAEDTPYITAEGGYIWVHSGPYHPDEELQERFAGLVDDQLIDDVVDELVGNIGYDWAPIHWGDDYDEEFGIEVEDPKEPLAILETRLSEIEEVLTLTGSPQAMALAQRLAYSNVITALESYLWETMTYAVENDETVEGLAKFPNRWGLKAGAGYVRPFFKLNF